MTAPLRARAAFAAGYGELGTFPIPAHAVATCRAIEASPFVGPEVEHLILEAGRAAGARAAREKSHDDLYDYHRAELGALLAPVLGRIERDHVAHELVTQAQVQTQAGATAVERHQALMPVALGAIRAAVHPEDRTKLDTLNAAGWSHATAYGQAEASATPKDGGPPEAAKVGALALGALTAMGATTGTAETATWTDAELETIAMGAAMAAGDGKAFDDSVRQVVEKLYSATRAQNVYVAQLHQALNQAFVTHAVQTFATPQFAWIVNSGNPCPTCTALAAEGPYAAGALPTTPPLHPNCLCVLEVVSAVPALV